MNTLFLSPTQAAYLAAFIDGEGSLECQKHVQPGGRTPRYVLRLSFTLATAEPLITIGKWLGLAPTMYPSTDEKRSPRYRMHITKNIAVPLLQLCLPYLILKRDAAALVLAIEAVRVAHSPTRKHTGFAKLQPMPDAAVVEMEGLYRQLRATKSNKRGMQHRVNQPAA